MNFFTNIAEKESEAFVWVLFSVTSVVVVVALLVIFYALKQKAKGKLHKNENYSGIIQNLFENGESVETVTNLARTRKF